MRDKGGSGFPLHRLEITQQATRNIDNVHPSLFTIPINLSTNSVAKKPSRDIVLSAIILPNNHKTYI